MICACSQSAVRDSDKAGKCQGLDWYEIGRADGASGASLAKLSEFDKICTSETSKVNVELYTNGRTAGLLEFCTPTGGLEAGRRAMDYKSVCPDYLAEGFVRMFKLGKKIHDLELKSSDLQSRIDDLHSLMQGLEHTESLSAQSEALEKRRAENAQAIASLESEAERLVSQNHRAD